MTADALNPTRVLCLMTFESSLWLALKEALPLTAHAVRVENSVELGTPDVNLCVPGCQFTRQYGEWWLEVSTTGWGGWVELKVQEAPVRKTTVFKCEHFTMEQRQWLVSRCRAGGRAYLLLQVKQEGKQSLPGSGKYLWIRGDVAAVWVGQCTLTELLERCEWVGDSLVLLVEYLQR